MSFDFFCFIVSQIFITKDYNDKEKQFKRIKNLHKKYY